MSDHAIRYKARALKQKRRAIHEAALNLINNRPPVLTTAHLDTEYAYLKGCIAVDPKDWDELVRAVSE